MTKPSPLLNIALAASMGALLTACTGTTPVDQQTSQPAETQNVQTESASDMTATPANESSSTTASDTASAAASTAESTAPQPVGNSDTIAVPIAKELKDGQPHQIDGFRKIDDRTIEVTFQTGDEACFGHRPVVEYDDDDINIGLVEGALPNAPTACKTILRTVRMEIPLDQPIGNRRIELMDFDDVQEKMPR